MAIRNPQFALNQAEYRLLKLNSAAIEQMKTLIKYKGIKELK